MLEANQVAAATGLRRRREAEVDAGRRQLLPPVAALRSEQQQQEQQQHSRRRRTTPTTAAVLNHRNNATATTNTHSPTLRAWTSATAWKLSHWYCWVSAMGAALAILTAPSSSSITATTAASEASVVRVGGGGSVAAILATEASSSGGSRLESSSSSCKVDNARAVAQPHHYQQQENHVAAAADLTSFVWDSLWSKNEPPVAAVQAVLHEKEPPIWVRWFLQKHNKDDSKEASRAFTSEQPKFQWYLDLFSNEEFKKAKTKDDTFWMLHWLDANILHPDQDTITGLIDKVLTSTMRLLLIANWLMALTVLLHTAVADYFLGRDEGDDNNNNRNQRRGTRVLRDAATRRIPPVVAPQQQQWTSAAGGRERMGGFLVFKLLLISAVVAPDTLDWLILLSWYTVLTFLRSLAALGAQTTDTARAVGHIPIAGAWKLQVLVLGLDLMAATVCVGLFHGAGLGMVLLLTCDCALLAVDVVAHILQHWQIVWEVQHAERISALEDEQLELHQQHFNDNVRGGLEREGRTTAEEASRELDQQMEMFEQQLMRKNLSLESIVFGLQLLTDLLTVAHFLHIWNLHGIQFTLIDGVLALHLHTSISSACKKLAERRNMYRIARNMDGMFEGASELDLRKAAASGDVCCICLGTMCYFQPGKSNPMNNVKKVACGHLYHTACLREVVERARSMEAAKCPLCRSYIANTRHHVNNNRRNTNNAVLVRPLAIDTGGVDTEDDGDFATPFRDPNDEVRANREAAGGRNEDVAAMAGAGEHALFRFSTEGMFPAWIPLPAFSFEVVRRPPVTVGNGDGEANGVRATETNINAGARNAEGTEHINNDLNERRDPLQQNDQQQRSLFRRWLLWIGAVRMSTAEERAALDQLVDMFPQYDRQDLFRALRARGSSEAVAESILLGFFIGVPRGEN